MSMMPIVISPKMIEAFGRNRSAAEQRTTTYVYDKIGQVIQKTKSGDAVVSYATRYSAGSFCKY